MHTLCVCRCTQTHRENSSLQSLLNREGMKPSGRSKEVFVSPHPVWIPFFIFSDCVLVSATDLQVCPKLSDIPLCCVMKSTACTGWKSDLISGSVAHGGALSPQRISPDLAARTHVQLQDLVWVTLHQLACRSSQWKFSFSFPVITTFLSVAGRMPHGNLVLGTASPLEGGELLPDCKQPGRVSSCCSEDYGLASSLGAIAHISASPPPLYPSPAL